MKHLVRLGLKLVTYHRAAARGLVHMKGMEDWTPEEHEGVANLILEDIRRENWKELEELFGKVGEFPEKYFGPEPKIELQ